MNITNSFQFYNQYHLNPINKLFHLIGIPMIIVSFMTFTNNISFYYYFNSNKYTFNIKRLIILFYQLYYLSYGLLPGIIMIIYFEFLNFYSNYINLSKKKTLILFVSSWVLQFIGHYIEGKKPALIDSIGQAFLGAPIFSLTPIIPFLKYYLY